MSAVEVDLATKKCPDCGEVKPISEFHRASRTRDGLGVYCKVCANDRVRDYQARKRAEIGEEAWLAYKAENVRRHRERTGNKVGKAYMRARNRAMEALARAHRSQFEALLNAYLYEATAVAQNEQRVSSWTRRSDAGGVCSTPASDQLA